jgi:hypothetical protein
MSESLGQALPTFQAIGNSRGEEELPLRAVWYIHAEGCLERVVLECGALFISILASADDDTVKVWSSPQSDFQQTSAINVIQERPWSSLSGKPFGWGWATVNQQGYCDGILLSFAGIEPQVCLNVVASSINVLSVSKIPEQS